MQHALSPDHEHLVDHDEVAALVRRYAARHRLNEVNALVRIREVLARHPRANLHQIRSILLPPAARRT